MRRAAIKEKPLEPVRMVHVRLEPRLHRRLRIVVAAEDTSVQNWLAQLIEKAVSESSNKSSKKEGPS